MDTFQALILGWLVVIAVSGPFGFWITRGPKKRFPEGREFWWGLEVLPMAFALAPMAVSAGYVGIVFPAALGILGALIDPAALTAEDTDVLWDCVTSVLITWGVLWLLRALCGWFLHSPTTERPTGQNDAGQRR